MVSRAEAYFNQLSGLLLGGSSVVERILLVHVCISNEVIVNPKMLFWTLYVHFYPDKPSSLLIQVHLCIKATKAPVHILLSQPLCHENKRFQQQ